MNGEEKLGTAKEELIKLDKEMEEFESAVGLSSSKYLEITDEEVKGMSPEELDGAAFSLANLAFHIQKKINKQIIRMNWSSASIDKIVGTEYANVWNVYSPAERRSVVIVNNSHAASLENIRLKSQLRFDNLNFLTKRIEFIADKLSKLSETKRRNRYG